MNRLEAKIRDYAIEFIESFRTRATCEFMRDFAFEFPIKIFLELMGLPLELTPKFPEWESGLLHASDLSIMATATHSVVT